MFNYTELVFDECRDFFLLRTSTSFRHFGLAWFVIVMTILAASLFWWFLNRHNPRLVVRSNSSAIVMALHCIFDHLAGPLHWYSLDKPSIANSCFYFELTVLGAGLMFLVAISTKLILYHFRYQLFKKVTKTHGVEAKDLGKKPDAGQSSSHRDTESEQKQIRSLYFLSSNKFAMLLAGCSVSFGILLSIIMAFRFCPTVISDGEACPNIPGNDGQKIYTNFFNALVILVVVYTVFETRYFPDPFGIAREALINAFIGGWGIALVYICFKRFPEYFFLGDFVIGFNPFFFTSLAAFINMLYSIPFQVYLARKITPRKMNEKFTMEYILKHPGARKLFQQHLVQEFSIGNLQFYTRAKKWKEEYDVTPFDVRIKVASNIYRKWLSPTGEEPINVSNAVRAKVEKLLAEETNLPKTLFDEVMLEVFRLMEDDSFIRFINGPLYRVFVGMAFNAADIPTSSQPGVVGFSGQNPSSLLTDI